MKMFTGFYFIIVVCATNIIVADPTVEHLNAVTASNELDQFFVKLYTENRIEQPTDLDLSSKTKICESIFSGSDFFSAVQLLSNPNENEIKKFLKQKRKDIFEDIFVYEKTSIITGHDRYANDSKMADIVVDEETFRVKVFTCLARNEKLPTARLVQYLVSLDKFNVNKAPGEEPIASRFVFTYLDEENRSRKRNASNRSNEHTLRKLILLAFAEEPARVYTDSTYYHLKRAFYPRSLTRENDPICKLSQMDRIRLCTSDVTGLRNWDQRKVTFRPVITKVSSGCDQRDISFGDKVYHEWTIDCYAENDGEPITFHLSQGYGYNEIFAFKEEGTGGLRVHHYGHRVALMKEKPTDNFGPVSDDADANDEPVAETNNERPSPGRVIQLEQDQDDDSEDYNSDSDDY